MITKIIIFLLILSNHLALAKDETYKKTFAYIQKSSVYIYADKTLQSKIGQVSGPKKIRVSNKSFLKGLSRAIVVSGKVGYISTKDIELYDTNGTPIKNN